MPTAQQIRDKPASATATHQRVGLVLGPVVAIAMLAFKDTQTVMEPLAWRTAGVAIWMAVWWATEAIPVAATALVPIAVFAPLGITSIGEATAPYAHPTIFLFMGGFVLALALERWNLHRRIALAILDRTGTDGRRLVGGFMLVCALLSMWLANTSTTMMLLPIVLSVIAVIRENVPGLSAGQRGNFELAMLLGLAYSASIGGLSTLIGTPPNALLIAFLQQNYSIEISFSRWMLVGVPLSVVMLPIAWFVLTRFLYRVDIPASDAVDEHLYRLRRELGPMSVAEIRVGIVFACVVTGWILRAPLSAWLDIGGLSDTGIVMIAAVLLFALPSGDSARPRLMSWESAARLPWGVLILFGGGLSLAGAVSDSGLALWLGQSLAPLNAFGLTVLVVASVALVIFLTELTSNLATTATLLPVMGAIAVQAGLPPLLLTVPVTIAASCAFMLPVATPPNAIVFSTGKITIPQMMRAGLWLNLIGIVLVTLVALVVAPSAL